LNQIGGQVNEARKCFGFRPHGICTSIVHLDWEPGLIAYEQSNPDEAKKLVGYYVGKQYLMPAIMLSRIHFRAMMILVVSLILREVAHRRVTSRANYTLDLFVMVDFGVCEGMGGIGGRMLHHLGLC
jgi:hypothetical protein